MVEPESATSAAPTARAASSSTPSDESGRRFHQLLDEQAAAPLASGPEREQRADAAPGAAPAAADAPVDAAAGAAGAACAATAAAPGSSSATPATAERRPPGSSSKSAAPATPGGGEQSSSSSSTTRATFEIEEGGLTEIELEPAAETPSNGSARPSSFFSRERLSDLGLGTGTSSKALRGGGGGPRSEGDVPPPPMAGSSLLAGVANLLNTVVGGGILSLPYAFRSCGLLVGCFYVVIFGLASWCAREPRLTTEYIGRVHRRALTDHGAHSSNRYGSWLLLDSLQFQAARGANSFEGIARASLGKYGAGLYNIAALVNCYGACVSYMVVIGDILPPLLHELGFPLFQGGHLPAPSHAPPLHLPCICPASALHLPR